MNDNEIITALERMSKEDPNGFSTDVLDLISNLRTENEELKEENMIYKKVNLSISWQRDERDKDIEGLEKESVDKERAYTEEYNLRKEIQKENKQLNAFKKYFDELYGTGLEVAKWHLNGETESFDNFYNAAMEEMEKY